MKPKVHALLSALAIVTALAACGSNDSAADEFSGGGPAEPRILAAQQAYLTKCALSSSGAAKAQAELMVPSLRLPGRTARQLTALAVCYEARVATCTDKPDVCDRALAVKGTLKNGEACAIGASCESGACDGGNADFTLLDSRMSCGTCVVGGKIGQPCDDDLKTPTTTCAQGLRCSGGSCAAIEKLPVVAKAKLGEICGLIGKSDVELACEPGAICDYADGAETPTCQSLPRLGESCQGFVACLDGARCDADSHMCVDGNTPVGIEKPCASNDLCAPGARCLPDSQTGKTYCFEVGAAGDECTVSMACAPGLFCVFKQGASEEDPGSCINSAEKLACPLVL